MSAPAVFRIRAVAIVAAVALMFAGFFAVSPAFADSAPVDPTNPLTPTTVTDDVLPTPQINGVVWSQTIVGNVDYAVGNFTSARPYGSPAGTNETPRSYVLAYNLTTGALISSFAPQLNAQAIAVAASPDGTRLYIGGDFTSIGGVSYYRIAAFNTATGAIITSFKPIMGAEVRTIVATNTTVYMGGYFKSINGATRNFVGAVSAATGATLPFVADADYNVNAMTLTTDGTRLIVGGQFANLSGNPALGLGAVDPTTGAYIPWAANQSVQDYGLNSSITSLYSVGSSVYGSGYVWTNATGNLEGVFQADQDSGAITGMEDCHGDTYSVFATPTVMYEASHSHYCLNIGGFPQTEPTWTFHHLNAFSTTPSGVITPDTEGYFNWAGQPALKLQDFFPNFNTGTFTGQGQAAWSITGNANYLVAGGEFTTINGIAQQGLTRFAVSSIAPNKVGPQGIPLVPTAQSFTAGQVRVSWNATYDNDNANLTYKVYRDNGTTPVYQTVQASNFYTTPAMGFIDTGLTPGSTHTYKVVVTDPFNNSTNRSTPSVTVSSQVGNSAYASSVTSAGATSYWPLDEPSPSTAAYDHIGFNDLALSSGVSQGATGPVPGATASIFNGTSSGIGVTSNSIPGPNTFTAQAWIQTTSTTGGKIIGFGASNTGDSGSYDRMVYMDNSGKIWFGVYPGSPATVTSSASFNDGQWHQVTAELSPAGMQLYVDGNLVGSRTDVTTGQAYNGYWRIGGDNLGGWPNQPADEDFTGNIAQVALYPTALSHVTVAGQYAASGRTNPIPPSPTDPYGAAVYNANPDFFYRLSDSSGSTAVDSGPNADNGVIAGAVTLGQPGPLTGAGIAGTSAGFTASNNGGWAGGQVSTSQQFTNPTNYSLELWFQTTSTTGGKLIGFGDQQTGLSSNYDRHVYMEDDGQLDFGTWTGQTNIITSPSSYNDGKWHYMVASQSSDGMNLYVDGALVGSNPQTGAQSYSGYWKIGGDNTWNSTSPYFTGNIGDVAVYESELTPAQIANHYALGTSNVVANQSPVAAFTSTTSNLTANFDGTGSTDPDGTVASYAWDFGDGGSSTLAQPTHAYTSAGTYTVKLTVTDNLGATNTVTHTVTVTAPNVPPVAAFTSSTSYLKATFDGTGSTDSDGTIASYAWTFGDGGTSTVAQPTHTYTTAGSYPVTLTVTDNQGASTQVSHTVTVVADQPPVAAFSSVQTNLSTSLDATASTDPDGTIASYAWDYGDGANGVGLLSAHTYAGAGTYQVKLTVTDDQGVSTSITHAVTVTAPVVNQPPVAAFTSTTSGLTVSVNGGGSSDPDGTVASYAWTFGDGGTATGATATHAYASAGSFSVTLTVTDNQGATNAIVHQVTVTAPPVNQPPVAAFTASTSNLTASVDGTASTDTDGTVASYAWNFGDSTTGTGATTAHTYAAAGTYSVTLTVTDNQGATNAVTHSVVVTAPVTPTALATDAFGRSLSGGWGAADLGGNYTVSGGPANFSVANGTGQEGAAAGATLTASLPTVKSSSTDSLVTVSATTVPTGGGVYISDIARLIGSTDYEARVWIKSTGATQLQLLQSGTVLGTYTVPGLTYTAGKQLNLRVQAFGTTPTTLRAKVWTVGSTEPAAWQLTTTDSTAALQAVGSPALRTYLSGSATAPIAVNFDNLNVQPATSAAPNQPPVAAFTSTTAGLTTSVNGSTSSDPDGTVASYAWTFGDGGTATGATTTHTYTAAGTYPVTLTVTDNQGATNAVTHSVTVTAPAGNQPPVAAFTSTTAGLTASVNGGGSSDPDGTVASYAWTFGDGGTATGATATHAYASAGTYPVTLTVTDNQGATNSVSHPVVVTAPPANQPPVASFTTSPSGLTLGVNGSGSTDPDGTVASYAWTFGDGGTATGATASHTYAAAGTYTVTLTVTDNQGATNAKSTSVTVVAAVANAIAQDGFGRTLASGWGSADLGGAYTVSGGAANFSVAGGLGQQSAGAGATLTSSLATVKSTNVDSLVTTSTAAMPTGGGVYISDIGRLVGSTDYEARVWIKSTGAMQLQLMQSGTVLLSYNVPTLVYTAGEQLNIRVQVFGTSPTTIRAKVWPTAATEPTAWQLSTTDATPALQVAGSPALRTYVSGSATAVPLVTRFSSFVVVPAQ